MKILFECEIIWISWIETEKKATSLEIDLLLLFLNPEPTFSRIILLGKFKVNFWDSSGCFFTYLLQSNAVLEANRKLITDRWGKCVVWLFWGRAGGARGAVGEEVIAPSDFGRIRRKPCSINHMTLYFVIKYLLLATSPQISRPSTTFVKAKCFEVPTCSVEFENNSGNYLARGTSFT